MRSLFRSLQQTRDWPGLLLMLAIFAAASWILLLPFSRFIQNSSLNRFQLTTSSYVLWALQQPIPALYNFENRYWISDRLLSADELQLSVAGNAENQIESGYANHFPARLFTFADARLHYLKPVEPKAKGSKYLYLASRYRHAMQTTLLEARPRVEGGFQLIRQEWASE